MNSSEGLRFDPKQVRNLEQLIRQGEGLHLEFKRKVAYPDKVVREIIAFSNTRGGTLLIGVDDDGTIPGVKYPEEEVLVLQQAFQKHCRPAFLLSHSMVRVSAKKFVIIYDIPVSDKRPHFFAEGPESRECYVRVKDMTIKASREVQEIVRRGKKEKDIRFTFGDAEKKLMEYLDLKSVITLSEFRKQARLNRFLAAKKLILLVLANVLRVEPTERGDLYSRV